MSETYRGRVEFLLVYVREAHPTDGWQAPANLRDGVLLETAKDMSQKEEYASSCVRNLGIKFTAVVDSMDNAVENEYAGFPDRLYLIGRDGRIAFKGAPGPGGFHPRQLEAAIAKELGGR